MPLLAALLALLVLAAPARAADYAPIDAPGPPLDVPEAELAGALRCPASAGADRPPVLLVPGTALSPRENFSWSWLPSLARENIDACTLTLPRHALEDVQVNGEYVAYAIRTLYRRTGRRVQVVGFSQGGMVPRWALRWWPDVRPMVEDLVGVAPSNHGTLSSRGQCSGPEGCPPSFWQQTQGSAFVTALNSGRETFAGIDYTVAYTRYDEVVTPNHDPASASSPLRTGDGAIANLLVQDLCPANASEHLYAGMADGVAYRIALDALLNPGPALPARVPSTACDESLQPGIDRSLFASQFAESNASVLRQVAGARNVRAEPPLACYVRGACKPRRLEVAGRSLRRVRVAVPGAGRVTVRLARRGRTLARGTLRAGGEGVRALRLARTRAGRRARRGTVSVRAAYAPASGAWAADSFRGRLRVRR